MSAISFINNGISADLKNKKELKLLIKLIFNTEGFDFEVITFIFCTDSTLKKLNKEHLKHSTLTDILTFSLSENPLLITSDIFISIERVKENAEIFNVTYLNELCRVMIHGILHLCGFGDHTPKLKMEMRKREDFYLEKIGFT